MSNSGTHFKENRMKVSKLIFVYAGDSGAINTLIHVAHKIVSPSTYPCNLCGLIYNRVAEKKEWTQFMKDVQQPTEFLHRDEFRTKYPQINLELPAVLTEVDTTLKVLIEAHEINRCKTTSELIQSIEAKLKREFL